MEVDFDALIKAFFANADWASIVLAASIAGFSVYRYFSIKKDEFEAREFENYHRMVQSLVRGPDEDRAPYIDAQIAVIFELRFMKKYHSVTVRILERSLPGWKTSKTLFVDMVASEAQRTIDFIVRKRGEKIRDR
ncbi:hypothetical protein [Pseudomonas sp. S3E17]|jgi:hypothetical protein|uniref:hypothetical protein n=1 Tax=Pseudomonas sp. S3E17 TaxID=2817893 RepID=UPI00209D01CC|nr:hypothetical protein [Pseudomonas sp. S3E17]MCP1464403.1 hypothetical protein [Pseudomonas sp. S3E17]